MVSATCRLCSAESCLSGVCIVTPVRFVATLADAHSRTKPHKTIPATAFSAAGRLNNADHSARAKTRVPQHFPAAKHSLGSDENDDLR
jgi:hypothetical protein